MLEIFIGLLCIVCQLVTALLVIRLIYKGHQRGPWVLIAITLLSLAIGSLTVYMSTPSGHALSYSVLFELIELLTTVLVLAGLLSIIRKSNISNTPKPEQNQEALLKSEAKFQAVVENSNDQFVFTDRDGRIVYQSPSSRRVFGFSDEEIIGRICFEMVHPDDLGALQDMWKQLLESAGETQQATGRLRDGDGSWHWIEVRAQNLLDNPSVGFVVVTNRDVTELRQAEELLRKSEEQYRKIVETAQEGIVGFDSHWRIRFANSRASRILGYSPDEDMLGRSVYDFVIDAQRPTIDAQLQMREQGISNIYEAPFRTKSGSPIWLRLSSSPIIENGCFAGSYCLITDITERIQAEAAMRRRTEEFETLARVSASMRTAQSQNEISEAILSHVASLFHAAAGALSIMDADGKHATVRRGYGRWKNWTGQQHVVSGGVADQLECVVESKRCLPDLSEALKEWESHNSDVPYRASVPLVTDHNTIGFLCLALNTRPSDEDLGLLSAIANLTANALQRQALYESLQARLEELQQAQAQIIQNEKLAAIGQLISGIAHELNNPLTSIVLYAQLLQRYSNDESSKRELDMIIGESLRARKIVRGLLDFARQRPPERKPVNINDVIHSALQLVSYELRSHDIELHLDLSPDVPFMLADPYQLQQVFVNLLNNAWQAISTTRGNGHLWIKTEIVPPYKVTQLGISHDVIRISVRDDGPGISDANLTRVFDPFFTTKPEGKGTGLGLSICHGIISQHGGNIRLESKVGIGSTFIVELPIVSSDKTTITKHEILSNDAAQSKQGHVLIIDDEQAVLEVLAQALRSKGYIVDTLSNAGKGLQKTTEVEYSVILCDIRMPKLNGLELHRQLSKNYPKLAKRIVFITGDTISSKTRTFIEQEGVLCLTKPFELDELYEVIRMIEKDSPESQVT